MTEIEKKLSFQDRLNSIEKYHFFDSDSRFPNLIHCRLLVETRIDEALARQAWDIAGGRQPLFGCHVESRHGRLCWKKQPPVAGCASLVSESSGNHPIDPVSLQVGGSICFDDLWTAPGPLSNFRERLDATNQLGPFLLVRRWSVPADANGENVAYFSEIWFTTHHALCDGVGAVSFINDWWQVYDNLVTGVKPTRGLMTLRQDKFLQRNQLGLMRWKFFRQLPFQAVGIFGATKFLFRKSATFRLSPVQTNYSKFNPSDLKLDKPLPETPAIVSGWIDIKTLEQLVRDTTNHQTSLNARLLGDLFNAIQRWRLRFDRAASPQDWIRVILPMNIREFADRRLPSINRTSIVQIDRRNMSELADPALFRSIDREINLIRKWQLDRMFLIVIRGLSVVQPLVRRAAQNKKPRGIAVFTNLGQPFRQRERSIAGAPSSKKLTPIEIDFLGPLRYGTPLNIAVARYQDRLRVTIHYDAAILTQLEASDLLQEYLAALRATISPAP